MVEIIGIDYGAKLSGNTAIAFQNSYGGIEFDQAPKKKDADLWIISKIQELNPTHVYLDAPLSLPAAYYQKGSDFHFREADRITQAMSPMFLGGLTARAISLKTKLFPIKVIEVYPAYFQTQFVRSEFYKIDIVKFIDLLEIKFRLNLKEHPQNWHQIDALLALIIGFRHQDNNHLEIGNVSEGIIII